MTRRLTVLQTLPALNSGGVERGTLEIARALVAAGHRSVVVSSGGRLVAQLVQEGSEHITRPVHRKSLMTLLQIRPFRRLLADLRPDIVHARSRIPAWIAWLALRRMDPATRPRFVTTVHGLNSVSPYSAIMTRGDAVIAVSNTVHAFIREHYPQCPDSRITVIHRGVDPAEFPYGHVPSDDWLAVWRQQHPELIGKRVIALPGRITRLKGHETFLRLIAELRQHEPRLHGLIVGGAEAGKTPYLQSLHRHIDTLGLADAVSFTGHRGDIREVLSQCDLVLSLSTKPETFGRAVLETLRLGVPVIGWDVGGVGEILARVFPEGRVPAGDVSALSLRVRRWLAERARPQASEAFQLSDMCQKTLKLYERLVMKP